MGRTVVLLVLTIGVVASACGNESTDDTPGTLRVLFVGNSLLYYNDLPSLFRTWANAQPGSIRIETEMLAEAGHSLSQHLRDGALRDELATGRFDLVILQEIGGWPLCASSDLVCANFESDLSQVAELVRRQGAEPIWMATWHPLADAQTQLSERVAAISGRVGVRTVDTGLALHSSEEFEALTELLAPDFHPDLPGSWFLAALLARAVQDEPLAEPDAALGACRRDWRGQGIVATELASSQVRSEPSCDVLDPALASRIVRDVNAAIGSVVR